MRWCCNCMYDGTNFNGWQSQKNGNTIQDFIENRLKYIFDKKIRIHGSGRTDAGVHARGQVFHFDGEWIHGAEKLLRAFGCGLPSEIQITNVKEVSLDFNARFSVKKKKYIYKYFLGRASPFDCKYKWSIGEKNIDIDKMNELGKMLLGTHNFSAFGAVRRDNSYENPIKTLYKLDFKIYGNDLILITEGSGYLYKMVRTLAATFLEIGMHKIEIDYVMNCFSSATRREKIVTAPACGLILDEVFY